MADIYILKMSDCKDILDTFIPHLSEKRRILFESVLIRTSKYFNIASEALLAYSLSLPLPCPYEEDKNGKPYISGQKHFNISHSGDYIVCAVSDFEIGVDTEIINRMTPRLMHKFLSLQEIKMLENITDDEIPRFLCEKWVRKEACLKLTGQGLRKSPTSLTFDGDMLLNNKSIFSRVTSLSDGQLLSVCSEKDRKINLHTVAADDLKKIKVN